MFDFFVLILAERTGRSDVPVEFPEMVIEIRVANQDFSGHSDISLTHLE